MKKNQIDGGVVIFEFRGGPRDGESVRSDVETDVDSTCEAITLWAITGGGQVGRTAKVTSGGTISELTGVELKLRLGNTASKRHLYRVIDRQESESQITVISSFEKTLS